MHFRLAICLIVIQMHQIYILVTITFDWALSFVL